MPCVVTDVGDSKMIVGKLGQVVESNNVESLQEGLVALLQSDYKAIGEKARERIIQNFSIAKMVKKTQKEIIRCVE